MWITQSYLSSIETNSKVFVYFMFEDYVSLQKDFVDKLEDHMTRMGDQFGEHVSLFMPNPRSADKIEAQVREIRPLWDLLAGNLPGLLVSKKPMADPDFSVSDAFYFKLMPELPIPFALQVIQNVRKLTSDQLDWEIRNLGSREEPLNPKYADAIELKPGIWGFRIDLKKLLSAYRERRDI